MSFLTIITPNKNHLEGLRMSAESLQTQTFQDWEHLVIDGASTDGSVEFCQNRPQTTILSKPDKCVEAAFTKGVNLALGKYTTFLLCYDTLEDKNWLKDAVEFLEKNPQYSMVSGTAGTTAYPYQVYPSGPKFNYYFFVAPWTVINETAFVIRTSILREVFPDFQTSNKKQDVFFQLWLHFFTNGYLVHLLPYQVVQNRTHDTSRFYEQLASGEFGGKVHDFYDQKRVIRHQLLTGKFHLEFKDSENKPLPVKYSRFAFTLAVITYKLNLFFIKKVLRRDLPKTEYGYCLHLGKKCVDVAVKD